MRGGTSGRSQSDPLGRVKLGRIKVIHYSTATSKYCCMCRVLRKRKQCTKHIQLWPMSGKLFSAHWKFEICWFRQYPSVARANLMLSRVGALHRRMLIKCTGWTNYRLHIYYSNPALAGMFASDRHHAQPWTLGDWKPNFVIGACLKFDCSQ